MSTKIQIARIRSKLSQLIKKRYSKDVHRHVAEAAVLIPIVYIEDRLHVMLTKRAAHLHQHAGQVSFPGGKAEVEDDSLAETARREMHEEVGLSDISILGEYHTYISPRGLRVSTFVGFLGEVASAEDIKYEIDPTEVADVFFVALSHLLNPENQLSSQNEKYGQLTEFKGLKYRLWGFTAFVLHQFLTEMSEADLI